MVVGWGENSSVGLVSGEGQHLPAVALPPQLAMASGLPLEMELSAFCTHALRHVTLQGPLPVSSCFVCPRAMAWNCTEVQCDDSGPKGAMAHLSHGLPLRAVDSSRDAWALAGMPRDAWAASSKVSLAWMSRAQNPTLKGEALYARGQAHFLIRPRTSRPCLSCRSMGGTLRMACQPRTLSRQDCAPWAVVMPLGFH